MSSTAQDDCIAHVSLPFYDLRSMINGKLIAMRICTFSSSPKTSSKCVADNKDSICILLLEFSSVCAYKCIVEFFFLIIYYLLIPIRSTSDFAVVVSFSFMNFSFIFTVKIVAIFVIYLLSIELFFLFIFLMQFCYF